MALNEQTLNIKVRQYRQLLSFEMTRFYLCWSSSGLQHGAFIHFVSRYQLSPSPSSTVPSLCPFPSRQFPFFFHWVSLSAFLSMYSVTYFPLPLDSLLSSNESFACFMTPPHIYTQIYTACIHTYTLKYRLYIWGKHGIFLSESSLFWLTRCFSAASLFLKMSFFSVTVKIQMIRGPMKQIFFIRSYDDKHLGCFLFLAVGDSAITNINLQMSLWYVDLPSSHSQQPPKRSPTYLFTCWCVFPWW